MTKSGRSSKHSTRTRVQIRTTALQCRDQYRRQSVGVFESITNQFNFCPNRDILRPILKVFPFIPVWKPVCSHGKSLALTRLVLATKVSGSLSFLPSDTSANLPMWCVGKLSSRLPALAARGDGDCWYAVHSVSIFPAGCSILVEREEKKHWKSASWNTWMRFPERVSCGTNLSAHVD